MLLAIYVFSTAYYKYAFELRNVLYVYTQYDRYLVVVFKNTDKQIEADYYGGRERCAEELNKLIEKLNNDEEK